MSQTHTHTYSGPGCPHCGTVFATRAAARTHQCDPATRAAWQAHLAALAARPLAPWMTDLGNGFRLNLPAEDTP